VRIAETVDHPFSLIAACRGLGRLYVHKGDLDEAIRFLERGREIGKALNIASWLYGIGYLLNYAYVLSGRLTDGLSALEQAVEMGGEPGAYAIQAAGLSEGYWLANRKEDAIRLARQAVKVARDQKHPRYRSWVLRVLGDFASQSEPADVETARASYREAMALADELGMRPQVAHCHLGFGRLYGRLDRHQEARPHLATAATMYREMDMRSWLEKAEAMMNESNA
jgi:tetratricopeptide (TPR) repeat protein